MGFKMTLVDTHIHVFKPGLKLAPVRRYVPEYRATIEDYQVPMDEAKISHAVLVQPSFLGTDNSYMCSVLKQHPKMLRGIAVINPTISEDELDQLQSDGVVGIRLNLDGLPLPDFGQDNWPTLLRSLHKRAWQIEIHREAKDLPELISPLIDAGICVVVDHFGRPDDMLGAKDPGFQALLKFGSSRQVWFKLSGAYRNGSQGRGFAGAAEQSTLLLEHIGADRLVWGSDWPHTRHESYITIQKMLLCLDEWVLSEDIRARILGANALKLFNFES